jgi:hypothetical protein
MLLRRNILITAALYPMSGGSNQTDQERETMLRNKGRVIQHWKQAMGAWRRTGDVSHLVAVAEQMEPSWRRVFLDAILPTGLRHDLENVLRRAPVHVGVAGRRSTI